MDSNNSSLGKRIIQAAVRIPEFVLRMLRAVFSGTWKITAGTLRESVRLAWIAMVHSFRIARASVRNSVRLGKATIIGTYKLARGTIIGSYRLTRATIRLNIRMFRAAVRMNIRYFKSWLRRSRFEFVLLINLYHAPYLVAKIGYWAKHPERYSETQRFLLARQVVRYIKRSGNIHAHAVGRNNLPKTGGYVMYPNHQGKFDALGIIDTIPAPCTVVMDEKKSHMILTKQVIDVLEGKRLEMDNPRQTVTLFAEIAEELRQGRRYIIFPEGGYENENGNQLGLFKPGAFKAAMRAKVPIVPVALVDSYRAFNSVWFGRVDTYIHYLKPIPYEEYHGMNTTQVAELVRSRIEERIRIGSRPDVKEMIRTAQG